MRLADAPLWNELSSSVIALSAKLLPDAGHAAPGLLRRHGAQAVVAHAARIAARARAGNVYFNRNIAGVVGGVQPFGGNVELLSQPRMPSH